jgi:hypothetical protein
VDATLRKRAAETSRAEEKETKGSKRICQRVSESKGEQQQVAAAFVVNYKKGLRECREGEKRDSMQDGDEKEGGWSLDDGWAPVKGKPSAPCGSALDQL